MQGWSGVPAVRSPGLWARELGAPAGLGEGVRWAVVCLRSVFCSRRRPDLILLVGQDKATVGLSGQGSMRPGAEAPRGRGGPPERVSHGRRQVKSVRTSRPRGRH